jgi:hypothetical protein
MSSLTTNSTSSSPEVLFPAFMYGEQTPCRRKTKAEAKKWAKAYIAGRGFPEPKLVPIAPGTVVFTDRNSADLVRFGYTFIPNTNRVIIDGEAAKAKALHLQWRLYLVNDLKIDAMYACQDFMAKDLTSDEIAAFQHAFRAYICQYSWGAIFAAERPAFYTDIESTVLRIEGVLRHWDALDTLKYIGIHPHAISLTEHVVWCFYGEIAMWVDQPTWNIQTDLRTAMEQMRQASAEEIYARLRRRLREVVDSDTDLKHRDWLRSPGIIEMGLEKEREDDQQDYDNLTSGHNSKLRGFLFLLQRNYGPDSDQFDPSFGAKT